jgi:hypothetical protein
MLMQTKETIITVFADLAPICSNHVHLHKKYRFTDFQWGVILESAHLKIPDMDEGNIKTNARETG